MVLTRLSHAGGACPLGKGPETACNECSPGSEQPSTSAHTAVFQKPLPPERHLLDLPVELLEKILSYVTFAEVSQLRLVCQKFNMVGGKMLTKTFHLLQNQTLQRFQAIKSQMPRRESLRRKHPLVNQCDIIETLSMRLSLLQMTFGKHMERKHICFFAGGILDEVLRIMELLRTQSRLSVRVTEELFDLSTMAMEYYKENIERRLPDLLTFGPAEDHHMINYPNSPGPGSTCASSVVDSSVGGDWDDWDEDECARNALLNKKIARLSKSLKKSTAQLGQVKRELRSYKLKVEEQARLLTEYSTRLDDHERKLDDNAVKFSSVLQDLSECKRELQYWRQRSARCPSCRLAAGEEPAQPDQLEQQQQLPPPPPVQLAQPASPPAGAADQQQPGPSGAPLRSPAALSRHSDGSETEEDSKMETRSKRKLIDGEEPRRAGKLFKSARKRVKN